MGLADRMVYTKADLVVGCRLGPSYAFSFYQFDYQDVVTSSVVLKATADPTESTGEKLTVPAKPMPVVKVVLDIEGFKLLLAEVNRIAEKVGIREA